MESAQSKLALIGCGKMGRLIEQLAPEHGFEVAKRLRRADNAEGAGISADRFSGIDVAIEFSTPEAAPENLRRVAEAKIPCVSGTTGWFNRLGEVTSAVETNNTGLVWSSNFSVGVAIFRKLAQRAAELLSNEDAYGAWAWEIHHDAKIDAPSGTLLHLVEAMKQAGFPKSIDISSSRAGKHPGTHEIGFDSAADTITLRHTARNREGFAHGALRAARWILSRKGVYTFDEVLFGKHEQA